MCAATAAERSSASSPCLRCKSPPDPDDCQALEPTARVYTGFVDEAPPGGLGKIEHEVAGQATQFARADELERVPPPVPGDAWIEGELVARFARMRTRA